MKVRRIVSGIALAGVLVAWLYVFTHLKCEVESKFCVVEVSSTFEVGFEWDTWSLYTSHA